MSDVTSPILDEATPELNTFIQSQCENDILASAYLHSYLSFLYRFKNWVEGITDIAFLDFSDIN